MFSIDRAVVKSIFTEIRRVRKDGILQKVLCYSNTTTEAQQGCQHDFARYENPVSTTYPLDCSLNLKKMYNTLVQVHNAVYNRLLPRVKVEFNILKHLKGWSINYFWHVFVQIVFGYSFCMAPEKKLCEHDCQWWFRKPSKVSFRDEDQYELRYDIHNWFMAAAVDIKRSTVRRFEISNCDGPQKALRNL